MLAILQVLFGIDTELFTKCDRKILPCSEGESPHLLSGGTALFMPTQVRHPRLMKPSDPFRLDGFNRPEI
jgi:hypothetical protein